MLINTVLFLSLIELLSFIKKVKTVIANMLLKRKNRKKNTQSETGSLPRNTLKNQVNSYYCFGYEEDGHSFLARLSHRGKETDVFFVIHIPKKGLFMYNDAITKTRSDKDEQQVSTPLTFTCLEPNKKWSIKFNSAVEHIASEGEKLDLLFEGHFYSNLAIFNVNTNTLPMAKLIAKKRWTKTFFSKLKKIDLVKTEQGGFFKGKYSIDDKAETTLEMSAIRTHTYGTNDLSLLDRCISLLVAFDNGAYLSYTVNN